MLLVGKMNKTSIYLSVLFCLLAQTSAHTRSRSGHGKLFRPADHSSCRSNSSSLTCGLGNKAKVPESPQIIGAEDVEPGEFPYGVAFRAQRPVGVARCGGVIIDERHILTAAHCFRGCNKGDVADHKDVIVAIGDHSTETWRGIDILDHISGYVIHEGYSGCSPANDDIALMKIIKPMEFNLTSDGLESVNKVCLPSNKDAQYREGDNATIAGWGHTGEEDDSLSDLLQKALIQIGDFAECQKAWPRLKLSREKHICAHQPGGIQTYCFGYSGGPLLQVDKDGAYTAIGITSYGSFNCEHEKPTIYTKISSYAKWIEEAKTRL